MTLLYVETSALVKRYVAEVGTGVLDELLDDRRPGESFVTSLLSVLEIAGVAARLTKGRILRRAARRELMAGLHRDLDLLFHVLPVDNALLTEAMALAEAQALRALDALHLRSAMRLREAAVGTPDQVIFVSSDREILAAAQAEGVSVFDPAAQDAAFQLSRLRGSA